MKVIQLNEDSMMQNNNVFNEILAEAMDNESELVLDFCGVRYIDFEIIKIIMRNCIEFRRKGNLTRMRNMPVLVRDQFLLSGLKYAGDEILI